MMPEAVQGARAAGIDVRFGDVSRRGVLEHLDAPHARAAVVTVGSPDATRRAVSLLRQLNPTMRILVRARRVDEIDELERLGADEVVPSEFEVSVELFVRLLTHLGVPRHVVRIQESLIRMDRYQALRGVGMTPELLERAGRIVAGGILENARVMEGSEACGRRLGELELRKRTGATVLGIVRDEVPIEAIDGNTRLDAGDLVVLFGPHAAIDGALRILEPPAEAHGA
jgi:K+:H+ antiporter